jgi:hypothetical protein
MKNLDKFKELFENVNLNNDKEFQNLILVGMDLLNLKDIDLAKEFDISIPTVKRWKNGKSAPYYLMRKVVYEQIKKRIKNDKKCTTVNSCCQK